MIMTGSRTSKKGGHGFAEVILWCVTRRHGSIAYINTVLFKHLLRSATPLQI